MRFLYIYKTVLTIFSWQPSVDMLNGTFYTIQQHKMGSLPDASNSFLVSQEHFDVIHVGLPILHIARMVRRHHPYVVVRPNHCPNRTVMGLHTYELTIKHLSLCQDKKFGSFNSTIKHVCNILTELNFNLQKTYP